MLVGLLLCERIKLGQMYLELNVEMMEIWWKLLSFNENF